MALPIIETPKYELTVPSTGKTVEFRPYLVKEEKILIMAMESKDSKGMIRALRDVVEACAFGKVDANDLALYDLEYMFMKIRAVSVGNVSTIGVACTNCETMNELQVDLNDIEVKGRSEEYKVKLTDSIGVVMKPPKVKTSLKYQPATDDYYTTILMAIVSCIDVIYDQDTVYNVEDYSQQDMVDFIESMSQENFTKLSGFFEDLPALKHTVEFDCSNCGTHNSKELAGLANFF